MPAINMSVSGKNTITTPFYQLHFDDPAEKENILCAEMFRLKLKPGHKITIDIQVTPIMYDVIQENIEYRFKLSMMHADMEESRFLPCANRSTIEFDDMIGSIIIDSSTLANGEKTDIPMIKSSSAKPTVPGNYKLSSPSCNIQQVFWPKGDLEYLEEHWGHLGTGIPIMKCHLHYPHDLPGEDYTSAAYIKPEYVGFSGTLSYSSRHAAVKPDSRGHRTGYGAIVYFKDRISIELPDNKILFYINNPRNPAPRT